MTLSQIEKYIELNFKEGTRFKSFGSGRTLEFKKIYYIDSQNKVFAFTKENYTCCIRNYAGKWVDIIN